MKDLEAKGMLFFISKGRILGCKNLEICPNTGYLKVKISF